jgi:hypothetical protein
MKTEDDAHIEVEEQGGDITLQISESKRYSVTAYLTIAEAQDIRALLATAIKAAKKTLSRA